MITYSLNLFLTQTYTPNSFMLSHQNLFCWSESSHMTSLCADDCRCCPSSAYCSSLEVHNGHKVNRQLMTWLNEHRWMYVLCGWEQLHLSDNFSMLVSYSLALSPALILEDPTGAWCLWNKVLMIMPQPSPDLKQAFYWCYNINED